jgi:anti-sigma B factor antagonist
MSVTTKDSIEMEWPEWLTQMVDSSGVASLVEGLKASRDLGSRFILIGLSTSAREVLQLSRLTKVFEIYDNEEQALAS